MSPALGYLVRCTSLAFVSCLFIAGAAGLRFIFLPALRLSNRNRGPALLRNRCRAVLQSHLKLFVSILRIARLVKVEAPGWHLPENMTVPAIVVANHPSALDSILLLAMIPNSVCIAKADLSSVPLIGPIMKAAGFVLTDSPDHIISECHTALREGANVLFFPEGTRTPLREEVGEFRHGVAALLLRSQAALLPVAIHCSPRRLYKNQPWREVPKERIEFRLMLCDPPRLVAFPETLNEERRLRPEIAAELRQVVLNRYLRA